MTIDPGIEERALAELDRAKQQEAGFHAAIAAGGPVTAAELVEVEAATRLAALRVESARQIAADHEAAEVEVARQQAEGERRREREASRRVDQLGQLRAIDSGAAARQAYDLRFGNGSRPTFPTTREEFFREHPDFVEHLDEEPDEATAL